jgi:ABC-type lipoprotein export system ATPase subunit
LEVGCAAERKQRAAVGLRQIYATQHRRPHRYPTSGEYYFANLVREALELVSLSARAKHRPEQLSGGQQQRVAVARAVVGDPKLILADEPTGNLDSKNGEEVMEMLRILNEQGATIVMVTHSPRHAERAHRIVNLLDGRVVPSYELVV